jgi:hypothetical protein
MADRATNLDRNREDGHMQLYTDYLKQLLVKIYGFDFLFLTWQGLVKISTCSSDHLYLLGLRKECPIGELSGYGPYIHQGLLLS